MKHYKLLLIPTALIISLVSQAQFKKGTLMLGTTLGSTAFSSASSDYDYDGGVQKATGTNTYTLTLGPQVGVFLRTNLVFGGSLGFSLNHSQVNTTTNNSNNTASGSKTTTTTSTVSLGPFLRCYFAGIPDRNWFYVQLNGAAGTGSGSNSGSSYTSTSTGSTRGSVSNIFTWNAGTSVGMTHFFYHHIGLDFALGYNYAHTHNYNLNNTQTIDDNTGKTTNSTNNYALGTGTSGITLGLGFHWFL